MPFHRRPVAGTMLICSLALALTACSEPPPPPEPPPTEVGVYTLVGQDLALTTELPGRTSAYRIAEVRPQVSGIVQRRLFTEGAWVEQGQQLYQIDPAPYRAALMRAEANLARAESQAKRFQRLAGTGAISEQQEDDAMAAWKQAQAEVEVARIDMEYTRVVAPISGRVGRSSVSEGALVANGQADELATVTQLDPIFVDISQPVTDMLRLRRALAEGDLQTVAEGEADVELILEDGTVYPLAGTLKFAEVSVDQSTGTVALRAQFPNPDKLLLPGMFVRARLQEGVRENALLVPQQAVVRDSRGAPSAWVLAADNSVHLRELQTLRTVGNAWLIGGGLAPGEQVVVEGLQRIRSGIVVKPVATDDLQLAVEAGAPGAEGG